MSWHLFVQYFLQAPPKGGGKTPNILLSKTLLFLCSRRQICHCNIVAKSGNVLFVVHPIRNLRHRHAARGFSSHQSGGVRTKSCRWNMDASKSVEVFLLTSKTQSSLQYLWWSVHTVSTPSFLFWGLQVCPAYPGSEAVPCMTFSSVLHSSKFHLSAEHLSVLLHLLLKLRLPCHESVKWPAVHKKTSYTNLDESGKESGEFSFAELVASWIFYFFADVEHLLWHLYPIFLKPGNIYQVYLLFSRN